MSFTNREEGDDEHQKAGGHGEEVQTPFSFLNSKGEVFVAEVADEGGGEDTKAVGDGGVEVGELDQHVQDAGVDQRDPAIDQIESKIFLPAIAFGMEHNILVTEKGVGKGDNRRGYDEDEIVDARIQKIVQGRVDEGSKKSVPAAHGKIPQGLVARLAEKRQHEIY
jgi:hypothetical protein